MTICWYVDDFHIPHKNRKAVRKVIKYLDGIYPDVTEKCGKTHDYLGMTFD